MTFPVNKKEVDHIASAKKFADRQNEGVQHYHKNNKANQNYFKATVNYVKDIIKALRRWMHSLGLAFSNLRVKADQDYSKANVSYYKEIMKALDKWMYSLAPAFSNLKASTEKYLEKNSLDSLGELTPQEKEIFQQFDKLDEMLAVKSEPTPEENEMFQLLGNTDQLLDNSHATKEDENSFGSAR